MTTTDISADLRPAEAPEDRAETSAEEAFGAAVGACAEQVFTAVLGGIEAISMYVGHELGLYRALATAGPLTAAELAAAADIDARYAREWLEQQLVSGLLASTDAPGIGPTDPEARRFELPAAHVEVLVNGDSLAYAVPFTGFVVGAGQTMDAVLQAYRTGEGVSFGGYGDTIRHAQADANRPQFVNLLGSAWLPAMPDIVARLAADPPALVADVGCGTGWSSISLAKAFPQARIHGIDLDEASIADARRNAEVEGVADRITFEVRNAADAPPGAYDLVCMFESLHDTGRPIDVLAALRSMAGPDGTVFIVDEKVADEFTGPTEDPVERLMYAASAMHCLLVGRSEPHDHAVGTMLREPLFRRLAADAGYRSVEVLPIENDLFRFYRLDG